MRITPRRSIQRLPEREVPRVSLLRQDVVTILRFYMRDLLVSYPVALGILLVPLLSAGPHDLLPTYLFDDVEAVVFRLGLFGFEDVDILNGLMVAGPPVFLALRPAESVSLQGLDDLFRRSNDQWRL